MDVLRVRRSLLIILGAMACLICLPCPGEANAADDLQVIVNNRPQAPLAILAPVGAFRVSNL